MALKSEPHSRVKKGRCALDINQDTLHAFLKDFAEAMKAVEKKYGVTVRLGRITYSPENFKGSLTVTNGHSKEDVARNSFDAAVWNYAHLGLGKGMYNRLFLGDDGKTYALQGFQARARKYPLIIRDVQTGQPAIAPEGFIRCLLNDYYTEVTVDAEDQDDLPMIEGTVLDVTDLD